MNLEGPIVVIEDDQEEAMLLEELLREIAPNNALIVINDSKTAIEILKACDKPFLIFSGINLNALNGFQLRSAILADQYLARKCSPYIFYAAHSSEEMLHKVYDMQASGYFHDINDYDTLGKKLSSIVNYWGDCAI